MGILRDADGKVLIAQRPAHKPHGGSWEFPGGKLNSAELPLQGLVRELREELGIDVQLARHLTRYSHDYPDSRVHLYVWLVLAWQGVAEGLEGQPLCWQNPEGLMAQGLLPADEVIAALLQADLPVNRTDIEKCLC